MYMDVMGWRLDWTAARNRLLGSSRFQAWASRTPIVRLVARRNARHLFDLTAGFVYTQIAAALIDSGLFAALGQRPLSLAEAARIADLSEDAALTLLRAAMALDLTEPAEGLWTLGSRGAMLSGTAGVPEMIAHHRLLYRDLADPLGMLRRDSGGALAALWHYGGDADPEAVANYSALMAASQPMVAAQALAAYRFGRHQRHLDIGGGVGRFISAVAPTAPRLAFGLFDLPPVVAQAAPRLAAAGLASRVTLHPGSFRTDPVPTGYDLVTLVRVLHDHDDAPAQALLRSIRESLPQHGRLLIVEPMAETRGAEPVGHAYFGFYLAAMRSGRPRTAGEIESMLRTAGFRSIRELSTPLPLVARALLVDR
ncbi:MAG: methyltransferase [Alphaproteobacteria bacterium]|nr:methyltransferase [Alphaproteobacteria bacterium]